jgi:broad specificity phosphatase PhoE
VVGSPITSAVQHGLRSHFEALHKYALCIEDAKWVQVQQQPLPPDSENLTAFWDRVDLVYHAVVDSMEMGTVCVVSHAAVHAALLCRCLGLSVEDMGKFRMSTAGVTVIEFPYEEGVGIVRCALSSCELL